MGKEGTYSALPVTFSSVELQTVPKSDGGYVGDDDGHDKEDLPLILDAGGATVRSDQEGDKSAGSDVPGAVFNLATSVIGAGIMALPATMRVLGLALGLVCIALMGALSELSIELLVRSSVLSRAASYGDAVRSALGFPARAIAEVCIVVNNAGILIVYLIIIGDVMSGSPEHVGVLYQWLGDSTWSDRRLVIFITLVIFLAPLCALEKLDSLSLTSAASVALAVVFVVVSCIIALIKVAEGSIRTPRMGPDLSSRAAILDLLVVVPIMTNAFVCHFNVQPIYNELRGRSPAKMNRVSRVTTALCVAVYASTAVSGYLLFGDDTESDVLTNFDRDLGIRYSSALNYIVRVGYVLHLVLVFPVIHFSLRQTVGVAVFKGKFSHGRWRMLGLTVVLLALIYLGSTMIPNIWVAFKFTGATTGLSLGFIFPALIALKLHEQGKAALKTGEKFFSWLMLVLAVVVSVIGVSGNIYSIQNRSSLNRVDYRCKLRNPFNENVNGYHQVASLEDGHIFAKNTKTRIKNEAISVWES